jgi:hypothetical protein
MAAFTRQLFGIQWVAAAISPALLRDQDRHFDITHHYREPAMSLLHKAANVAAEGSSSVRTGVLEVP